MKRFLSQMILFSGAACFVAGCGGPTSAPENKSSTESSETKPTTTTEVLLTSEPAGAKEVIDARKSAVNDEEVVLVGRIGGSENPWVDGRAVFSIVDNSLKACSDIPGDGCAKPWDYCCETDKLPTAMALIKVVDEKGTLINEDARKLLNLKELQTVVVKGKAQRDDAGNLTVFANGIFVRN
ncbi:MAG: hypothetical protein ABIK07_21140 [Planctomycetota bacterium]|jgi:hypothetical protein|uniref:hypothetical protein n=1 Tax=uncultured Gimesia sp. TaxID=1678688 RepID=UPI00261F6143|nr:hypothetical protein [uncultured Gimesia sp.]